MIGSCSGTRPVLALSMSIALAAVVACADTPLAPETATAAVSAAPSHTSAQALPWHITATVIENPPTPMAGCLLYFTTDIDGTATHAGHFSGVGNTCVTDQVAPDPEPPFVPDGPPPYATVHFTNPRWTLTAADGDEIWIENVDAVAVISLADNSLRAVGTQRIIGGTGRFAGATGEATVGAEHGVFSGEGWIRFGPRASQP